MPSLWVRDLAVQAQAGRVPGAEVTEPWSRAVLVLLPIATLLQGDVPGASGLLFGPRRATHPGPRLPATLSHRCGNHCSVLHTLPVRVLRVSAVKKSYLTLSSLHVLDHGLPFYFVKK